VILHAGRVRAAGTLGALTAGGTTFTSSPGLDARQLATTLGAPVTERGRGHYQVDEVLDAARTAVLAAALDAQGAPLDALRHGTSLEDRYLEIVGDTAAVAPSQEGRE